jgi:4-amino-4-deoxy-L-arabinose transferase-like glycosyltransferase
MRAKSIFFTLISCLAFLLCLLPIARFTYKHPAYNWDMLGYMALVVRMDSTKDINKIHDIVYNTARQSIPYGEYEKLTTTPAFRKSFEEDPSKFEKLLPIYIVKPLYIWSAWAFYKAGFPLVWATIMPSILAYLMTGLFLFYWFRKYLKDIIAFIAGLLVMLSAFTVAMTGLSTPDFLSTFFLFVAFYFILEKQNILLMFCFFLLAVFTRVDNGLTCFFILSFLTFSPVWMRITKLQYFLMLGILAASYLVIIWPVREFGWNISFYSQYARQIDFSRDFNEPISFTGYMLLMYSKLVTALVSTHFTFFLFLALLVIGNPFVSLKKPGFDQCLILLLLAVIFVRFVLLPDLSDRFYVGFYLIIIILLVRKLSALIIKQGNS